MDIFFACRSKSGRGLRVAIIIHVNEILHVDLNLVKDIELQSNPGRWNFACRYKSSKGLIVAI